MSRFLRTACAAIVLVSGLFVVQLTTPSGMAACSCAPRGNVAGLAGDPEILVLTGTIDAIQLANGPFGPQVAAQLTILRVFQGRILPGPVPIVGGDGVNCVPTIADGQHVVLTARIAHDRLEPTACGHFGLLTTPEGQALLRDVEAVFGPGTGPAPPATTGDVDLASIALIAVGALVAIVLVGALVMTIGRRDRAIG